MPTKTRKLYRCDVLPSSSSLKHQLHFINRRRAWQTLSVPLTMRDGVVISYEVRQLAQVMFRAVMKRHRRPALHRLNMVVDQRMVTVSPSQTASHFRMWARLSTLDKGKPSTCRCRPIRTSRRAPASGR
ncbi:hypothetical protein [Caballeronia sp. RCC_10]|uniref:hypothetical protein n=1 Tax=Caballeronia sp. RCC_10 TaxID=3239227 RepID=UPI003526BE69